MYFPPLSNQSLIWYIVDKFCSSSKRLSFFLVSCYQSKTALHPHKKLKWVFEQYYDNSSLNPTVLVSYHVVTTLMMKTWTSGKSRGPTSWPSANIKLVSQGRSAVSVANLHRNSVLRNNNPQSWCYWLYWSVLMTMAAALGDAACLALCNMLSASPDATLDVAAGWVSARYCLGSFHGHQCCLRTNGLQNTTFSLALTCRKPIVVFCRDRNQLA